MDYSQHRLDYCEFLISSQINYTQTYLVDHSEVSMSNLERQCAERGFERTQEKSNVKLIRIKST